jgi:23S rRNA (guanine745-N1)-methyltransferase
MTAGETSLRCERGHDFALSKKGYADFCPAARAGAYDDALFDSRSRFIAGGFYGELIESLKALLEKYAPTGPLLDAGCGEGSFLKALCPDPLARPCIGLDLSRPGVQRAARGGGGWLWAVGDLSRLPLAEGSMAAILNILSPANYPEFRRVLLPGGTVLKVVPGERYLHEVRALAKDRLRRETYSNERVLKLFEEKFELLETEEICSTYPLTPSQAADLIAMTPLTQGIEKEQLDLAALTKVTIHLHILAGRPR